MKRVTTALLAASLLLASCGTAPAGPAGGGGGQPSGAPAAGAAPAPSRALTKVILGHFAPAPEISDAAYWAVPYALGYFQQEGLDVSWQPVKGSNLGLQLVESGKIQFTESNPDPLIIADQKGAKEKSFFEMIRKYLYAVAVLDSSPVKSLDDLKGALKGAKVGVSDLSSGGVPYMKGVLQSLGLSDKDVQITAVGVGAQAATALKTGQVKALALWEGAYAQIRGAGYQLREFRPPFEDKLFSGVIATSDQLLQSDPQLAVKFGRALAKGILFNVTNPQAAVRIYWEMYPQTKPQPGQEQKAMEEALAETQPNIDAWKAGIGQGGVDWGAQSAESWSAVQDFDYSQGIIKQKLDVKTYYTDALQQQIDAFDHNAIVQQAKGYNAGMIKYRPQ